MKRISLFLVVLILVCMAGSVGNGIAFAAEKYSSVLEDFQKDPEFDVAAYPEKQGDYSLDVIQIAESTAGELFVYVYQPAGEAVRATELRMSTGIEDNFSPRDYSLTLLSVEGTLAKYIVENFEVKTDMLRYYSIVQISRPYNVEMGDTDVSATTVPYVVGSLYTACTVDGEVFYNETHEEVVIVTDKYSGYVRYSNGFKLYQSSCDSHFVAFSTDHDIETLYEAEVFFMSQDHHFSRNGIGIGDTWTDEPISQTVVLTYTDKASNPADGLFGTRYTWNRIEKAAEFVANEDLTDEAVTNLEDKQWVLRFYESDYENFEGASARALRNWTVVNEITILRLKFETNGQVYNIGVVDNKQNEDNDPVNEDLSAIESALQSMQQMFSDFIETINVFFSNVGSFFTEYWWVIVLVLGIVLLGILCAFVKPVFTVVKYVLIGLWYVITAPIQLIVWIVRKAKEKKG